jgi:hypothetical protein
MRYEVRVTNYDGTSTSFELVRDEPLKAGDLINPGTIVYKVRRILPGEGDFDAVAVADWAAGPAQGMYVHSDWA